MSDQRTRACPNCRKLIDERDTRCPHCGTNVSIITVPLEPLPPDEGAPEEDAEETLAGIEPEILPPNGERSPDPWAASRSGLRSLGTSLTTVSTTVRMDGRVDADVNIELSQELIDPEKRLSTEAYRKLMRDWSDAIEREIEAASSAGQSPGLAEAMRRVPLPFGPNCGAELPLAIRREMQDRAQQQAAQLWNLPRPEHIFGPHAAPEPPIALRELISTAASSPSRRRGITITCGTTLGLLLIVGVSGITVMAYALGSGLSQSW